MRIHQVCLHRLSRLGSWAAILGLAGIRLVHLAASWSAKSYPAIVAGFDHVKDTWLLHGPPSPIQQ